MIGAVLSAIPSTRWVCVILRCAAVMLAVALFLLSLRRAGERAGRLAERLDSMETTNEAQRRMLDAAARRPRGRSELAERLRDGSF